MRGLGTVLTVSVVAFWVSMNVALFRRVEETHMQGRQQRGASTYLSGELRRERWMEIFRKSEKVGYTGFSLEKQFDDHGYHYVATIEMVVSKLLPPMSFIPDIVLENSRLKIIGRMILDREMKPVQLRTDIYFGLFVDGEGWRGPRQAFSLQGDRDPTGEKFLLRLELGSKKMMEMPIALESMTLSDGLAPILAVGDYKVGEKYKVPVIDPLSAIGLGSTEATIEVVGERTERIHGVFVDFYVIEMTWRQSKISAWVTRQGEIIRQDLGPPTHLTLKHSSTRDNAVRRFEQ